MARPRTAQQVLERRWEEGAGWGLKKNARTKFERVRGGGGGHASEYLISFS